jgi:membrane protein YdbS with pleckstrin-like domain
MTFEKSTAWLYRGIWRVLAGWFRVPAEPPSLPVAAGEHLESLRPANAFLSYLKFKFWIVLFLTDTVTFIGWLALTIFRPRIGLWLAPIAFIIIVLPDVIAYVAIHLRYDTTWYVLTHRSLRIRRGIWVIRETTITFENIQNVSVDSGPLERWFGIARVVVDTAGGGSEQHDGTQGSSPHKGLIEGIQNAEEIRDLILRRLRASRSSGLGDESAAHHWSPQHIAVLREIRNALAIRRSSDQSGPCTSNPQD